MRKAIGFTIAKSLFTLSPTPGASGVAITLVTRDDSRLVSDIEKLIKKRIDLEAIELDDERPRRPPRRRDEDEAPAERRSAEPAPRRHAPSAARDPFFDKPYESSDRAEPAAWEKDKAAAPAAAASASARVSPNIRPKRKVASLLGGGKA